VWKAKSVYEDFIGSIEFNTVNYEYHLTAAISNICLQSSAHNKNCQNYIMYTLRKTNLTFLWR